MDLNHLTKVDEDDVIVEVFNDDKEDERIYNRTHLILFQFKLITGCSTSSFAADIKKWDGSRDICINNKSKKKISFAGLELRAPSHSTAYINPSNATFKGASSLTHEKPDPNLKLYPVALYNRTFIG